MKAMVLHAAGEELMMEDLPRPKPGPTQLLIRVQACGVCRTDLHIIDGELDKPNLPLIPGHQIVGTIEKKGSKINKYKIGDKIGVPWLGYTCGECRFCRNGQENLCDFAKFTGYEIDGGFAEFTTADARFCFPIPAEYPALQAAPLLCAGLIGYRSLRKTRQAQKLGFYGFGSSAHILTQTALYQGKQVPGPEIKRGSSLHAL